MGSISLEGMAFFAHHGFYEEEQRLGNRYEVDILVEADIETATQTDDLSSTVNYEVLYLIVREEMGKPSKLLEHVAGRILDRVQERFPSIEFVEVNISKFNPPVGGVCGRSRIKLQRKVKR